MVTLKGVKGRLLYDSAVYGGSDVLLKLIAFFTFPLLANALSSSGFGMLELAMSIVTLGGVFVRCGLNNAVQRFYWDEKVDHHQKKVLVSAGLYISLTFGVGAGVLMYLLAPYIFSLVGKSSLNLSVVGAVAIAMLLPLTQWVQYVQDVIRLHFSPWKFLGYSFVSRALGAFLAVAVVLFWHAGVESVLLAQALVLLFAVPLGVVLIRKDIIPKIDSGWSRRLLAFGAPFIFTEIAYWLFSSIDRWMLASIAGVEDVGLYSVAFRFSSLALFVATAFGMAWSPYAVKLRTDYPQSYRHIYAHVLLVLLVVMLVVAGIISLFSGEILGVFLPAEYAGAATPLAILCFTTVLQASQQVTAIGISLAGRTKVFAYLVWAAASLNVVMNMFLIPSFGVAGAAWATLLAYVFLSSGFMCFTQRYYPLPFAWWRLVWILMLGGVVLLTSIFLQRSTIELGAVSIKFSVAISCLLLAWPALNLKGLKEMQNGDETVSR